ncbi:hypothetical protein IscW_ISCW001083 [Ixodes scapularis]|uniref:Uncharacterized protein n=1 Tax=Ixodes scapularis TaxID=6945 RepID=B7P4C4_IXOSC|nr:hypothetical protein IscW_ISCW001083 [Ixodes scapularis]|eukprot:XP_002405778.1 hypothetical protein IscW_ISCW001083 [Ixodes scapularis]
MAASECSGGGVRRRRPSVLSAADLAVLGTGAWYGSFGSHAPPGSMDLGPSLTEWVREQPLSILQLDPADRAVLRIAGKPTMVKQHCG